MTEEQIIIGNLYKATHTVMLLDANEFNVMVYDFDSGDRYVHTRRYFLEFYEPTGMYKPIGKSRNA